MNDLSQKLDMLKDVIDWLSDQEGSALQPAGASLEVGVMKPSPDEEMLKMDGGARPSDVVSDKGMGEGAGDSDDELAQLMNIRGAMGGPDEDDDEDDRF